MKIKCACAERDYAEVVGYTTDYERDLEGMTFIVRVVGDKLKMDPPKPEDRAYLKKFNMKEIEKAVIRAVQNQYCPDCEGDLEVVK